jgi:Cu-processing system permease protein
MDFINILVIAQKELKDARRNRWLLLYSLVFGGLALTFALLALSGSGVYNNIAFGRITASLINLVILIVPLMGLSLGALGIAEERERGILMYMLSQPVTRVEILLGKYFGLAFSLLGALMLGFGCSGIFIALKGGTSHTVVYIEFIGITFLLTLVSLSFGFLISILSRKTTMAIGLALFTWLFLVFFTDLGLMGTALVLKLKANELLLISLINPLQVFKLASILILGNNLDILGPGGTYAVRFYGNSLLPVLLTILIVLTTISLSLSCWILKKTKDV